MEKIVFEGHIVLCGWSEYGETVINSLQNLAGNEEVNLVLVNELPEDEIHNIVFRYQKINIKYVRGDFSSEGVLELANIRNADSVIILPDRSGSSQREPDERTIFATLAIKEISPKVKVYAHILNPESKGHLRRANVDDLVLRDEFTGYLLAAHVMNPGIPQAMSELMDYNVRMNVFKREIPENFVGRTFGELAAKYRNEEKGIVIGLTTEHPPVNVSDVLSADPTSLDAFIERKFKESGMKLQHKGGLAVKINPAENTIIENTDAILLISDRRSEH